LGGESYTGIRINPLESACIRVLFGYYVSEIKEQDMTTQSFPVGDAPRVVVSECRRDLEVEVWDERAIEVECNGSIDRISPSDEAFTIENAHDNLRLRVPADAEIVVDRAHGDVVVRGVRTLTLNDARGDVLVEDIENGVRIDTVGGDLEIHDVDSLTLTGASGGDVTIRSAVVVAAQQVGGDAEVTDAQTVTLDNVGGDCSVISSESFRYGTIGGDLQAEGNARTVVVGGGVGGDAAIKAVGSAQLGDIGGDCAVKMVGGDLHLGSVGGDCAIADVNGEVRLGSVGGDADIKAERAGAWVGNIGGDLHLSSAFPPGSTTRITVGGDAAIELPHEASVALRATVGGDVSGERIAASGGGMFTAVYGEGAAKLDLIVGGDLALRGGGAPRTSSSAWSGLNFGEELGRMGEELGREFNRMGEDLERELSGMFGPGGKYSGDKWERKVKQRVEEQVRRAEQRARRAEDRARRTSESAGRRAGEQGARMHVRINDREWRFDAERLERLKQQAREAAREGISGAIAAMERALAGLGVPSEPPRAPNQPVPPESPTPPVPPMSPATGRTIRIDVAPPDLPDVDRQAGEPAPETPRNVEEERAAILQMIAEGRISPEEGDMLLDALGS
jgi:hypothetical protein